MRSISLSAMAHPQASEAADTDCSRVCANSLSQGCLILMDDLDRQEEQHIVQRWSEEFEFEVLEMHDYGVLRMRQPARIS